MSGGMGLGDDADAQKKGGKSYDSYKYVFRFLWFQVQSPLAAAYFICVLII